MVTIDGKERYIIYNHWKIYVRMKKIKGEPKHEILNFNVQMRSYKNNEDI